ncbi:GGDEF domain-containing protein [Edaphobacter aggregans]|uniref:GGDEF domain-containing protein n=1 Tax=Edaphobacter aggregans TaxID=570835 RepID=UPI000689BB2F|nr:GGDEF domain-containing protein [Edaphobacter aggregans]
MDTTTLVLANVLLFALYAGVMLVNARVVGGTRGAMWFAGANLCRGVSMLLVGVSWLQLGPAKYATAISAVLAVVGALMLHHAFAELLERGALLREAQYGLIAGLVVVAGYFLAVPTAAPLLALVLCVTLGVQFAIIAAAIFRYSGEEVGAVGWLTSLGLSAYSLVFLLRAVVASHYRSPGYSAEFARVVPIWLMACLVTTGVTAFGFMSLTTAKLRVELLWRAQVDELTGLLNRWALKRVAMREIQRCRRLNGSLAIVMIDLDGLKVVNDTKGHSCGDVVLQAVAGVLQETVRGHDSVARMGGDEFCVLLPETSLAEAMTVAERLRVEIHDMVVRYRGEMVRTRASLGVASSDVSGLAWQSLMDLSDTAMYRAKREGRNRVLAAEPEDIPAGALLEARKEGAVAEHRKLAKEEA